MKRRFGVRYVRYRKLILVTLLFKFCEEKAIFLQTLDQSIDDSGQSLFHTFVIAKGV